jgi:hypothetical protein
MNFVQPNLLSFAFVDTTMLLSTMTLKYGKFFRDEINEPPFQDCRHMDLRGPADPITGVNTEQVDYALMADWPSARQLVGAISAKITEQLAAENLQLGRVYVESLCAGGVIGWHSDESAYAKAHQRFRLLISPCSGGQWFSGGEVLAPGVGNLTYFNNRVLNSAINLGPVPQISVVLDVRRPSLQ